MFLFSTVSLLLCAFWTYILATTDYCWLQPLSHHTMYLWHYHYDVTLNEAGTLFHLLLHTQLAQCILHALCIDRHSREWFFCMYSTRFTLDSAINIVADLDVFSVCCRKSARKQVSYLERRTEVRLKNTI